MRWHRIRVSIRTQLIAIVLMVALFSLLVLAVVTGVYFTSVFTQSRVERLQVIAQLKASQIQQSFIYYYYQCYLLSTRDTIETALSFRRAGNTSSTVVSNAISTIEQTVYSSVMFNEATLYDLDLNVFAKVTNDDASANISTSILNDLYVLSYDNDTGLPDGLISNGGYIMGPLQSFDSYFMSLTLPVYTNNSVLISTPTLSGYLSVIVNVDSMESTTNTTSSSDYSYVDLITPAHPLDNLTDIFGFYYVFKPEIDISDDEAERLYNLSEYPPTIEVYEKDKSLGHYTDLTNPFGRKVSVGYSVVDIPFANWMVTVEQTRGKFMGPTLRLVKIITGVCIGIAAFMCIVTFPLAHYGVRPIIKLQKATEQITERRGLLDAGQFFFDRKPDNDKDGNGGNGVSSKFFSKKQHDSSNNKNINENSNFNSNIHSNSNSNSNSEVVSPINDIQSRDSFNDSRYLYPRHSSLGTKQSYIHGPNSVESLTDTQNSPTVNYAIPAIVQRKGLFYDELSELTEAFNAMTEELDKQYAHLEDRVRARTKELEEAKIQADSARQQAEDANEAKTVFIANISHELRTPLNGILGMTSIAMAETETDKIQSSLELIFRSGELLLHILTQLLTFSKNQLDKSKLQKKNFQILEVATQVRSIFGKTAKDQNVDLNITIKPDIIRKMVLFADSNRIIQVIMNLVSNSLKFTPEKGSVNVTIKIVGEYDEERSKLNNYEHVYIKNELNSSIEGDETTTTTTTTTNQIETDLDPVEKIPNVNDDDVETIHTLRSSMYKRVLSQSYKFGAKEVKKFDLYDDGDGDDEQLNNNNNSESPAITTLSTFEDDDDDDINSNKLKRRRYVDFTKPKKWVLELSVSDTGTGIDESLQEKIFEAFVQGDQTLSRSYGGTGLGLSICKQFAKMMHGTLKLKSKVGEGSTFTFIIPIPQIGELIIDESNLKKFYDDEFNEMYPKHKKVSFVDINNNDLVDNYDDNESNGKKSNSTNDTTVNSDDIITHENNNIENKRKVSSQSSKNSNWFNNKQRDDDLSAYFEKPELITRASTGTAHSQLTNKSLNKSSSESSMTNGSTIDSSNVGGYGSHVRFLVAEDNLVNQEVIKRMLRLEGFTDITLACDGNEAINIVKETQSHGKSFDLIFMDVQMPSIDGLSATKIIRSNLGYIGPIVALTAFADKSNEDDCLNAGMSGFLAKPVRRNILRKIILEYCPIAFNSHGQGHGGSNGSDDSNSNSNTNTNTGDSNVGNGEVLRKLSSGMMGADSTIDEEA
ncbi:hypothetical protein CANARDRAFT_30550 [[Candida] arabinofermentans NRRL YB-2248]|uniref:histidine kinase n=1 Tax=[Candida] arabinofermentans NRRL YB-2248 TaxID=983967 RepID=A0A1E4STJ6_9ASCO|nr:hypothetical protein CANARDRAFT_30550 [[Candida] arabinofermentans NRRL YB-2248]